MEQFLGFSHSNSSLIAMVRNLHTRFISLHVVLDDKFDTIVNDGKSTEQLDLICDELFANSRDVYTEKEYNDNGIFLYKPPPLDEVWLLDPGRRMPC